MAHMIYEADDKVPGQGEEWENILKDVTVQRDGREILFDPVLLPILQERYHLPSIAEIGGKHDGFGVVDADVKRFRRAVERKLSGKTKLCVLLLMLTGWSNPRIGRALAMSKDTVRRHLESGAETLERYFRESGERTFPRFHRSRKVFRVGLFPLDTDEERRAFQDFSNENMIVHVAYSGGDDFREVMVIYMTA